MRRSAASIDSVLVQQTAAGQPATSTLASPATGDATVWPPLPTPTPTNIAVELGVDVRCAPSGVLSTLHLRGTLGAVSQAATVVCPLSKIETVLSVSMRLEVAVGNVAGGLALWYPNGYGKQQLHNLTVQLCDSAALAGSCATPWSTHLGLRVAEVVQDPLPYTAAVNDTNGPSRSMYWRVNGQPVWGKGANNIPSDQFESRVTPERLWSYLTSARDAHMTTLRVWGGGLFERDEFYEFCDQLGLLIYHDMMWSDQIYPWHTPFLKTAADETRYQVRHLLHELSPLSMQPPPPKLALFRDQCICVPPLPLLFLTPPLTLPPLCLPGAPSFSPRQPRAVVSDQRAATGGRYEPRQR